MLRHIPAATGFWLRVSLLCGQSYDPQVCFGWRDCFTERKKGWAQTSLTPVMGGRLSGALSARFHSNNERKNLHVRAQKELPQSHRKVFFLEKQLHFYLRYLCGGSRWKAALGHLLSINKVKFKRIAIKKTSQEWENIMFIRRRHRGTWSYQEISDRWRLFKK